MPKYKLGFHNFLNAQPLLLPLIELAEDLDCEVCIDTPSSLAEKLRSNELDLAMIPSVEYLKQANSYKVFHDIAIASCDRVDTVLFIANKNIEEIRTIALDNRSKTSVALFQILFGDKLSTNIKTSLENPEPEKLLEKYDALLIIGDPAFKVISQFTNLAIYDLSHEWFVKTGKPFVHAVIAIRPEISLSKSFVKILQMAKINRGKRISEISKLYASKLNINERLCEDYLTKKIIYDLDENTLEGLRAFQSLCFEKGLIEAKFPFKFFY